MTHWLKRYEELRRELNLEDALNIIMDEVKAGYAAAPAYEKLLDYLAMYGGEIVSTASLNTYNIDQARASGRMYVRDDSLGFVWMPPSGKAFPETVEEVEQFEKWFPLEAELPDGLKSFEDFKSKISTPAAAPAYKGDEDFMSFVEYTHSDKCYFIFDRHDGIWRQYASDYPMTTSDLFNDYKKHILKNTGATPTPYKGDENDAASAPDGWVHKFASEEQFLQFLK